ncbi:predicted protein [Helicobacter felis ATCC 49179]|uniref:Uncharacterized protein n=1 Tax=Helicobacter felis (strain ATCC 49179 / CCUG 28539 / NCTC 12436 / CS1) TaxID=936155 RepID=E7A9F6_HELFC|nr:predicted protein [Helicobacter felis ATCC 49179]
MFFKKNLSVAVLEHIAFKERIKAGKGVQKGSQDRASAYERLRIA